MESWHESADRQHGGNTQAQRAPRNTTGLPPRPPSGRLRLPALSSSLRHFTSASERAQHGSSTSGLSRPPRPPSPPPAMRSGTPRTLSMPAREADLRAIAAARAYSGTRDAQPLTSEAAPVPLTTPFHQLALVAAGGRQALARARESFYPSAAESTHHVPQLLASSVSVPPSVTTLQTPSYVCQGTHAATAQRSPVASFQHCDDLMALTLDAELRQPHSQSLASPGHMRSSVVRRPLLAPRGTITAEPASPANSIPSQSRAAAGIHGDTPSTPTRHIAAAGVDAALELSPQQAAATTVSRGESQRLPPRTSVDLPPRTTYGALLSSGQAAPHFAVGLEGLSDIRVPSMSTDTVCPATSEVPGHGSQYVSASYGQRSSTQQGITDERPSLMWGDNLYSRPTSTFHTRAPDELPWRIGEEPRLRLNVRRTPHTEVSQSDSAHATLSRQTSHLPSDWRVHSQGVAVLGGSSATSEASISQECRDEASLSQPEPDRTQDRADDRYRQDAENQDPALSTADYNGSSRYGHFGVSHDRHGMMNCHSRASFSAVSLSETCDDEEGDTLGRAQSPFWPLPGMVVSNHLPVSNHDWGGDENDITSEVFSEGDESYGGEMSCQSSRVHSPALAHRDDSHNPAERAGLSQAASSTNTMSRRQQTFRPLLPSGLPPLVREGTGNGPARDDTSQGRMIRAQGRLLPPPTAPAGASRGQDPQQLDVDTAAHASGHADESSDPSATPLSSISLSPTATGLPFQQWMSTHAARLLLPHHMRHMADLFTADVLLSSTSQQSQRLEPQRSRERFASVRTHTSQLPELPMQRGSLFSGCSKPTSARSASRPGFSKECPIADMFGGRMPCKAVTQVASDAHFMAALLTSLPGVDPTSSPVMNMVLALAGAGRASQAQFSMLD